MYQLLIIDNNNEDLDFLANTIESFFSNITVYKSHSYNEALSYIINPSIIFHFFFFDTDFVMSQKENCFFLDCYIRSIDRYQYTPFIYCTSFFHKFPKYTIKQDFAFYLDKPYIKLQVCQLINHLLHSPLIPNPPFIITDIHGVIFQLTENDIIYIEAAAKMITVHTITGSFCTRQYTLAGLQRKINYPNIVRCHKKYIINLNYCKNYDRTTYRIHIQYNHQNGTQIPVGRTYKNVLDSKFFFFI